MTIDDDYSSIIEEKSEEDFGVIQLDDECADSLLSLLNILERPHASQNHPAFINFPPTRSNSEFPGLMLTTLFEDEYRGHTPDAHDEKNRNNNHKAGCLTKRFSFIVPSHKNEVVGVSLGDMNDKEWKLFLEAFKKLLPKVFETRKSISLIRRILNLFHTFSMPLKSPSHLILPSTLKSNGCILSTIIVLVHSHG
ncbi:hypothetical protein Droror1_Dr00012596 [Drosera rotundifolia]